MIEDQKTKKAFVTYVIEQSLFEIGGSQLLEKVSNLIQEKYGCDITECYRHPDYLNNTLDVIYGKSHKHIVNSIRMKLSDFVDVEPITDFLTIVDSTISFEIQYKFKDDYNTYSCTATYEQYRNLKKLEIIQECIIVNNSQKNIKSYQNEMQKALDLAFKNDISHIHRLSEIVR